MSAGCPRKAGKFLHVFFFIQKEGPEKVSHLVAKVRRGGMAVNSEGPSQFGRASHSGAGASASVSRGQLPLKGKNCH